MATLPRYAQIIRDRHLPAPSATTSGPPARGLLYIVSQYDEGLSDSSPYADHPWRDLRCHGRPTSLLRPPVSASRDHPFTATDGSVPDRTRELTPAG